MIASWANVIFNHAADFTPVASTNAEASLLAGQNLQPVLLPGYFLGPGAVGKALMLRASGIFSTTVTPTMIFQVRLGTTAGSSYLSGISVGVSAAITTGSGVTNKQFTLEMMLTCTAPGIGSGNCTLSGSGWVRSFGGFASPFEYAIQPTTPDTATWTSVIDAAVQQYLNVSLTWSANSSSNTCTLKSLLLLALN